MKAINKYCAHDILVQNKKRGFSKTNKKVSLVKAGDRHTNKHTYAQTNTHTHKQTHIRTNKHTYTNL